MPARLPFITGNTLVLTLLFALGESSLLWTSNMHNLVFWLRMQKKNNKKKYINSSIVFTFGVLFLHQGGVNLFFVFYKHKVIERWLRKSEKKPKSSNVAPQFRLLFRFTDRRPVSSLKGLMNLMKQLNTLAAFGLAVAGQTGTVGNRRRLGVPYPPPWNLQFSPSHVGARELRHVCEKSE